ncbi:MAG: signal recognition particle receptor subunit alpha [Candidatus Micrarchaeota archaeon]
MDLGAGLRKALAKITGAALVDEKVVKELVKELQRVLIANDVEVKLVFELSKRIEKEAMDRKQLKGVNTKEHVVKVVYDELVALMGEKHAPKIQKQKVLLLGLYGSGKTTSVGKLAHFYKKSGLTVGVVCCDVDRPAAFEQLQQIAESAKVNFYGEKGGKDAAKIAREAVLHLKDDVLIIDSAGRNAFSDELKGELKKIDEVLKPDERFLVVSADIGQVAGRQAREFNSAVPVTGVIITKMDGSGKGGGALSSVGGTDAKVAFIGVGEKLGDFEPFDAKKYVGRLLGFPDLETLIEKVKEISEQENLKPEMLEEKFTIKTFYEQLKAAKKLGPLKSVFSMLGMVDVPKDMMEQSEQKLKIYENIIGSMTKEERENAELLRKNKSRIERIAKGSGTKPEDVKELLSRFSQMEKMLSQFKHNRGFRKKMEHMMKKGGGANLPFTQ